MSGDAGAEEDAVADAADRLAVLLAAGLAPLAALRAVGDPPPPIIEASACDGPDEVPEALVSRASGGASAAWGHLAVCWALAVDTGAPLAATLGRAAESLRALADARRHLDLTLAGPLATARIVALLPFVGIGMGALIGADPIGVILGSIPGAAAAVTGIVLLVAGCRWNGRLVAAARRHDPLAGAGEGYVALALAGGLPPDRAFATVEDATARMGVVVDLAAARASVDSAARAGVPVAALLRAEGARLQRIAWTDAMRRATLLGTRLLAPLALCFLPAFVLLGVVPLALGILRGALAAF